MLFVSASGLYINNISASAAYLNGILVWSGSAAPAPPPVSGLVTDNLFMELDASDYTSGTWNDRTANANNATINGATWVSTDGGIFDFDGINDTISIPHKASLSLSTSAQRTIQVWVKFDTRPTSSNRMIVFSKLSSGFAFDGYFGGPLSDGRMVVATNGTSIARTSTSTLTMALNTWYLITFVSQITGTANTTKVYVNETEFISAAHGTDGYSEANPLTLGYMPAPLAGLGLIQYLNGKIGACYFYTKGLSAGEVSQNYNASKTKYGL